MSRKYHGSLLIGTLEPEPKAQAPEFSRASGDAKQKLTIRLIAARHALPDAGEDLVALAVQAPVLTICTKRSQ